MVAARTGTSTAASVFEGYLGAPYCNYTILVVPLNGSLKGSIIGFYIRGLNNYQYYFGGSLLL